MHREARGKILIVEDDAPLARGLKLQLESKGFEIRVEPSGSRALKAATEEPVDLVILDLILPDMSGYEVCKQMRRLTHPWEPPVLMLTAMIEPVDRLRGFAYGADAYMTKPCQASELIKTITKLIGEVTPPL